MRSGVRVRARRARIGLMVAVAAVALSSCTPVEIIRSEFAARGATSDQQDQAIRVASCESGHGDPSSIDPQAYSQGNYGMFQINWTAQRQRVEKLGFTKDQLGDPTVNARVAADLWIDLGKIFGTTAGWSCARRMGVR